MNEKNPTSLTVDQYVSIFPTEIQILLDQVRAAIKEAAPEAEEVISYQMPAYKYHGMLAYFAANKNHIGFYPTASPIIAFKRELVGFKCSKGAIQFSLNQALSLDLIK